MPALSALRGNLRARTNPSSYGEQVDEDAPDSGREGTYVPPNADGTVPPAPTTSSTHTPPTPSAAPPSAPVTVQVPANARPGQQLRVSLPSGQSLVVTVPPNAVPGGYLQLQVRAQRKITVSLPAGVQPGQMLSARAPDGSSVMFSAPPNARAGLRIHVALPDGSGGPSAGAPAPTGALTIVVPQDWVEGRQLTVMAPSGQRLAVNVPPGTRPGATLKINVPPAGGDAAAPTPPAALGRQVTVKFKVPEGHPPGAPLAINVPGGGTFHVNLPPGAPAGTELQAKVPAAPGMEVPEAPPAGTAPAAAPAAAPSPADGAAAGGGGSTIMTPDAAASAPPYGTDAFDREAPVSAASTAPLQWGTAPLQVPADGGGAAAAPQVEQLASSTAAQQAGESVMPSDADGAAPLAGQWAADGGEVDLADLFLGIDVNAPLTAPAGGLPAEVGRVAPL